MKFLLINLARAIPIRKNELFLSVAHSESKGDGDYSVVMGNAA
ncbi:MAG: hypothetical protein ACJAS3_003324 [Roseivirga sp.]|jgi:hypothetical protein